MIFVVVPCALLVSFTLRFLYLFSFFIFYSETLTLEPKKSSNIFSLPLVRQKQDGH